MRNAPCHAADGGHFFIIFEPRQQLGLGAAVFVQVVLCLLDTVQHLVQPFRQGGDLAGAVLRGAVGMVTLRDGRLFRALDDTPGFTNPYTRVQDFLGATTPLIDGPEAALAEALPMLTAQTETVGKDIRAFSARAA